MNTKQAHDICNPEINKLLEGCQKQFQKEVKVNNEFRLFLFTCGKWKELSNTHHHMDWCPTCKAKLKGILSSQEIFEKKLDNMIKFLEDAIKSFVKENERGAFNDVIWHDAITTYYDNLRVKQIELKEERKALKTSNKDLRRVLE